MLFSSNYQIMNSGNLIFNICMSEAHCAVPGDFKLKVNTGPVPGRPPGLRLHGPSCATLQRGPKRPQAQTLAPGRVVAKVDPGSGEADGGSGPQDTSLLVLWELALQRQVPLPEPTATTLGSQGPETWSGPPSMGPMSVVMPPPPRPPGPQAQLGGRKC